MKHLLLAATLVCSLMACNDNENGLDLDLQVPSDLNIERSANNKVTLNWKDNSSNEDGYIISRRGVNDQDYKEIGRTEADITKFAIEEELENNKSYYFTVKAYSSNGESRPGSVLYKQLPVEELVTTTILKAEANSTCASVSYQVQNIKYAKNLKYGLCWSADQTPTINDEKQEGPELATDGKVLQAIPNILMDYGKTYKVRAYVTSSKGTYYSTESTIKLENEVPAITLTWNKLSKSILPSEVELYETTTSLNGRNFHAWYAIGNLSSGKIEVRVNVPDKATTIDDQLASFNGDCYLMVNGGYFYNGKHTGLAVVDSKAAGSISAVRGSLKAADEEYNIMYNVTRAIFGVDTSGKPAVYWAGSNAKGTAYYFNRPLPSIKGEAKYGEVSATNPTTPVGWTPKYALSAGPVLLKESKIPFDFTLTSKGTDYYLSNYEIMPYDIFGTGVSPDRTAIGYRQDGKVIIFICDGRIAESQGASMVELAQILKGLGCVSAINLDGGGSTGMAVGNEHINDYQAENRPVVSTIGFFKKK